jgi:hypothetical protein
MAQVASVLAVATVFIWRSKLNSQFIVRLLFCMRAGCHSDFRLVQSTRNAKFVLMMAETTPFNYSARGGGAKAPYSYCYSVFNLNSEIFEKI